MSVAEARDLILEAAGPVFAERGYRGATVREICAAAGVNVAAVNYYFGDKSQLYVETVGRAHQLRAEQIPMPAWPAGTRPEEKLRGFIGTLLTRMLGEEEAPWPTRLMLREVLRPTEACRSLVEDYFRPQFELLLSILDEMLPCDVPDARRHQLAFSIIGQCFFYRAAGEVIPMLLSENEIRAHFGVEQLADHVCELTCAVLSKVPQAWRDVPVPTATPPSR